MTLDTQYELLVDAIDDRYKVWMLFYVLNNNANLSMVAFFAVYVLVRNRSDAY